MVRDPDFPDPLRSLIQEAIPTVDAAELLLALARTPGEALSFAEVRNGSGNAALPEGEARRVLAEFQTYGLVAPGEGDTFRYAPANRALDAAVKALARAYNERPVTLVRMIYAPKDDKIRSFADAFRLKK